MNSEEATKDSNTNKGQVTKNKNRNKNLFNQINNLKKLLKKNGYINFRGNININLK